MTDFYYADTIAAIATAKGYGGVGIIRRSGPSLIDFIFHFLPKTPIARRATRCQFLDSKGKIIDDGLLIYFPAPHSFTGEDVVELHTHGGPVVMNTILNHCISLGARLAEAGEFTKRAFLNDKLDLIQAEGIDDLIHAQTEAAARSAINSLQGGFSERIELLLSELIELRMLIEASLDFPEEDIDFLEEAHAKQKLANILRTLSTIFQSAKQGAILREGMNVVLIGKPNVGKSTLMNALADQEVSIVTSIAGTTRDLIKTEIMIDQVPFHIIDTAGLHDSEDEVEKIGISRAWHAIDKADIAIIIHDHAVEWTVEEKNWATLLQPHTTPVFVNNKIDLSLRAPEKKLQNNAICINLSAKTKNGIELLRQALLDLAGWQGNPEGIFLARQRHIEALSLTKKHLEESELNYHNIEILAESLRLAQFSLGKITGEFNADDLLGEIFSRFCIGK